MTNHDFNYEYWLKVATLLNTAINTVPCGEEPEAKVYHPYPDEDWKNQAENDALETEYFPATDDYLYYYFTKHKWNGRTKAAVPFYAGRRLDWARRFLRVLLATSPQDESFVIPAALISPEQFLCWLLIDAYSTHRQPHE